MHGLNEFTENKSAVILDLQIEDNCFAFAASVDSALENADAELVMLKETVDSVRRMKPNCDRLDYILAAGIGALCGVIDVFLVGKPGESPIGNVTDQWFADRTIAFAKLCHPEKKDFDSLESAIRFLEKKFGVPYDQTGIGDAGRVVFDLNAKNHHFKSLAHNPSLFGLFFSILDQFTNTSHFVTNGQLISLQQADEGWYLQGENIPGKLFCGFVNWIGHLMSDVSGSNSSAKAGKRGMGIPSPLWTWTNDLIAIKAKLGINVTEFDKQLNGIALNIFEQGYDVRFQSAQAIPVFVNELLVRFVYSVRRLIGCITEIKDGKMSFQAVWNKCEPFSNATVKRMLTVAHGAFCLVDLGDAAGRGFICGAGTFNVGEFVLRLNIVGIGRFSISLYGEAKRAISYVGAQQSASLAEREINIVENYIEGLKQLSEKYDDERLLLFIKDIQDSAIYVEAFGKSARLAELRGVPTSKVLKTKKDIDRYFGAK